MTTTRRAVVRATALIVVLTGLSQMLGFARDAVMAAVFGTSASVDAFLVAQGLMNLVLGLITGAMSRAIIPTVSRAADTSDSRGAQQTVQVALTVTMSVLLAGSVIMFVAARPLLTVLASGFDSAAMDEGVRLTRIVLLATLFIAATNLLAGVAQAHGRFFWAGLQGIPFNAVMIAAAALFGARFGGAALAVGFVAGSAVRLAFQLPAVRGIGLSLRPSLRIRDPGFREMLVLMPPLVVGNALLNFNTIVDRAVGSTQGAGTIAALSYGWRVVTLVEVVVVTAFTTTLFPAFSTLGTPERRKQLRRATDRVLGVVIVLVSPGVILLAVAAKPIVVLLFARGNFDARAVSLTTIAVATYSVSLAALAVREVVARTCLAIGDSRTPVWTGFCAMAVNVVGDLTLGLHFGVTGLAFSTSASMLLAATVLSVLTARRHRAVGMRVLGRTTRDVLAASAVSTAVCWLVIREMPVRDAVHALLALGTMSSVCLASYIGILYLLRTPALADIRDSLSHLQIKLPSR
ncbi:murein biosynthesis integral membrane protein MurJ [Actinopolymorpha rutila]|uniref:Lipid II flippase n=1 Tax=Actinopolymorpha rutila TaxID=446787 RepID=A0A852ZJS1_9ACTN|nr:murein biosynthesis integral membrane protein MurJ [Actinopolymorpha rutila]NYH93331.1 putative peptidoglycan lipid II flippase [Actinopolymorpha rutila]